MAMRLLVGMSNDVGVLAGNSMGLILDARGVHNNTQCLRTVTQSAAPLLGRTSQVHPAFCSYDEIKRNRVKH